MENCIHGKDPQEHCVQCEKKFNARDTRVFFVVDSKEEDEELFETARDARKQYDKLFKADPKSMPRLYVALVKNAYPDGEQGWNYSDNADTFEIIKFLFD